MKLLKVLIIAPSLDGTDIGEVNWAYHWVEALSRRAEVTVLASSREGRKPLAEQLPHARVVTWPEIKFLYQRMERVNAMAKLGWPLFAMQARRWIRNALSRGERFDIAHQILPMAMRHVTPLRGFPFPFVIGPCGGALQTPAAFRNEVAEGSSLASRLRAFDGFRLRHDPRLRDTYAQADLVLGVAPYAIDYLRQAGITINKSYHILNRGSGDGVLPPEREKIAGVGCLQIAHVGRAVRTKGLRDVIRAMAYLEDLPEVTLISAGDGEDLPACRAEVEALGLSGRVKFVGKIPRTQVEKIYANADLFCFPSFREPTGGVFFEAMAHGLPVITAACGGADFIIDDGSGIRIPVSDPQQFPKDIAAAIRALALDPARRLALGQGARERLASFGTWEDKADTVISLYHEVLAARATGPARR